MNKDARTDERGPSSALARITRQLVTSLRSPSLGVRARARTSAVVEREISDVRYLDSSLRRTVESPG